MAKIFKMMTVGGKNILVDASKIKRLPYNATSEIVRGIQSSTKTLSAKKTQKILDTIRHKKANKFFESNIGSLLPFALCANKIVQEGLLGKFLKRSAKKTMIKKVLVPAESSAYKLGAALRDNPNALEKTLRNYRGSKAGANIMRGFAGAAPPGKFLR